MAWRPRREDDTKPDFATFRFLRTFPLANPLLYSNKCSIRGTMHGLRLLLHGLRRCGRPYHITSGEYCKHSIVAARQAHQWEDGLLSAINDSSIHSGIFRLSWTRSVSRRAAQMISTTSWWLAPRTWNTRCGHSAVFLQVGRTKTGSVLLQVCVLSPSHSLLPLLPPIPLSPLTSPLSTSFSHLPQWSKH